MWLLSVNLILNWVNFQLHACIIHVCKPVHTIFWGCKHMLAEPIFVPSYERENKEMNYVFSSQIPITSYSLPY